MSLIDVSLIEDDGVFADSLSRILNGTPGFRCVSTHATGEDALEDLPFDGVDVVLTDLSLPGIGGAECIRRLRQRSGRPLFMVLTVHEDADKIFESLKAGATGYILKRTPPAEIIEAISELVRGGAPMSPAIARKVAQHFHLGQPASEQLGGLTDREREILHFLSGGRGDKEIGRRLDISAHTVRYHLKNIYVKLQVHSRGEATAKYLGR